MSSLILNVTEDTLLATTLNEAGNKLVIVDFFATWCGPCVRMKPKFKELAEKYTRAQFVEVDVDLCQESAMLHGVSAMPTFLLFRNATKIDMIRGADPAGLEDAIKKWYGEEDEADDSTIAKGQMDLTGLIDSKGCECLNGSDKTPFENVLKVDETYLESDCDEQLIMMVSFNQAVKLHSLKIYGPAENGPKTVKMFLNQSRTLDFESAEHMEPVQELQLTKEDLTVGSVIPLRYVKFQNVNNITLFVKDNQGGKETTRINYLCFIGCQAVSTNMSDFKRVSGKKGESH